MYICISNNPIVKCTKDINKYFAEDKWITNKYVKRYSTSLAIREVQIKITMNYYHIFIRIKERKHNDNTECCPG
jgi:hypothetical protein